MLPFRKNLPVCRKVAVVRHNEHYQNIRAKGPDFLFLLGRISALTQVLPQPPEQLFPEFPGSPLGWHLRLAVPLGIGTLITFAVAVAINLYRGRDLPCYCFDLSGGESI